MDKHFVNGAFVADELVRDAVHQALATIEPLQKQRQQMTGTFEGWFWVEDVAPHLFASACELACPSGAAISQPVERSVMISLLLKGENGQFVPEGAEPVSSHVERAHIVALGEPRLCSRVLAPGQGCRRVELGLRAPFLDVNADALSAMDLEVLDYLMRPGFRSYHLPRTQTITHMDQSSHQRACRLLGARTFAGKLRRSKLSPHPYERDPLGRKIRSVEREY